MLIIWNICACTNCVYILMHTINEFPDMIWSWNLHWGYTLIIQLVSDFINLVRFHQLLVWFVNCTLSFFQIYYVQTSPSQFVWKITLQVSSCTPERIFRKSHESSFMLSKDPIYQGVSSMQVPNWYHVREFVNSMYWAVMESCKDFRTLKVGV